MGGLWWAGWVGRRISNGDDEQEENGLVVAQLVSLQILCWTDVPSYSNFGFKKKSLLLVFFREFPFIGQLWIWFSVTDLNERNKISSPVDVKEKEQLVTDIKYSKSHLLFPHHWLLPLERFFWVVHFFLFPLCSLRVCLSVCVAYFFLLLCLFLLLPSQSVELGSACVFITGGPPRSTRFVVVTTSKVNSSHAVIVCVCCRHGYA